MKYKKNSILLLICLFLQSFSLTALSNTYVSNKYKAIQGDSDSSSRVKGLSKFSHSKFFRKEPVPHPNIYIAKQIEKAKLPSPQKQKHILDDEKLVSFSGKSEEQVYNSAITTRGALYGTKESFEKKKENKPMQINARYKNGPKTSTHVHINSQDKNSPLYSPLNKEKGLNAAGVYVETELSESTKAHIGGEIRSPEALSSNTENTTSQGVAVGLSLSF